MPPITQLLQCKEKRKDFSVEYYSIFSDCFREWRTTLSHLCCWAIRYSSAWQQGLEYNSKTVFSFSGEKRYSFPKEYASIHFLSFLTEQAVREFHDEAIKRKKNSAIYRQRFTQHSVAELFDDLMEALTLIRSDGKPMSLIKTSMSTSFRVFLSLATP